MPQPHPSSPNAAQHGQTLPNTQRLLPIESVEQSDGAYISALDDCKLPPAIDTIVRWVILTGTRDNGKKRLPDRTQRQLAQRLNLSRSSVCTALQRLRVSRLLTQADGWLLLDLSLLVSIAEKVLEGRQAELPSPDPKEALESLLARPCSALLGSARLCSALLGGDAPVSVRKENTKPVTVSVSVSRGSGGFSTDDEPNRAEPSKAEQSRAEPNVDDFRRPLPTAKDRSQRDDCLKSNPDWQALQTRHFRTDAGRPNLDVTALRACFYAAVAADLFDADNDDHKTRFLATAWDLAHDRKVNSPAVCLRKRVERSAVWRISPAGATWAKRYVFPEYADERNP